MLGSGRRGQHDRHRGGAGWFPPSPLRCGKRDVQQAAALKERLLKIKPEAEIITCLLDEPNGSYRLLVNATPVGMYPNTQSLPGNPGHHPAGRSGI